MCVLLLVNTMFGYVTVILALLLIKLFIKITTGRNYSNLCLVNKTALVVGGSTGLGYQVVLNLASRDCKVIIANRTKPNLQKIIEQTDNPNISFYYLDLASLDNVREFVQTFKNSESNLDFLINNSGCAGFDEYTKDGLPKVMQVNYFGHFLLTHLLMDYLKASKGRIISVSSLLSFFYLINKAEDIKRPIKLKILHSLWQYGNSKVCQLLAVGIFAKKLEKFGVSTVAVHPGLVHTDILLTSIKNSKTLIEKIQLFIAYVYCVTLGKTVVEGADPILHCILEKNINNSGFYCDGIDFWKPPITKNVKLCEEIWKETERLVMLRPEEML